MDRLFNIYVAFGGVPLHIWEFGNFPFFRRSAMCWDRL